MMITSARGAWTRINHWCFCSWDKLKNGNTWSCRPCLLPVQKTPTVGMSGRGICSVIFSKCFDGSFIETCRHRRWRPLDRRRLHPWRAIHFESLEFIVDRVGSLSLSIKGNGPCAVFMGMAHNGSPSLHTILEDFNDEFNTASNRGGALASPSLKNAAWWHRLSPSHSHHRRRAL
jgi:hypothetical protein